jgi:hypothetical protein
MSISAANPAGLPYVSLCRLERAPCGNSLFCVGGAAPRVTLSLQILFGKNTGKISPEPP